MTLVRLIVLIAVCSIGISFPAGMLQAFSFNGPAGNISVDRTRADDPELDALSNALAHYVMGGIYDNYGKTRSAIAEYEEALSYRDDVADIYIKMGADFLLLGELTNAGERLNKAIEIDPGNIRSYLLLAVVHTAKGEYREAQIQHEKVLEQNPDDLRTLGFLSDLFVLRKQYDKAADIYERMLKIDQNNAFLYFNLGIIYSKADQLGKAEESLKKAIELDKSYVEAQMVLGFVYEVEGNLRDAIKQYRNVVEINPAHKEAHARLGHVYFRQGEMDEAIGEIRELIRLDPHSPESHLKLFSIYVIRNRYDDAKAVLEEALAQGVSEAVIYASLGYVSILDKDYKQAIEYYKIAVRKEPKDILYRFYLGVATNRSGNKKKAIHILEGCVSGDIDFPEIYNYLGYLYVEEGKNLDRAVKLIRKALELDPENGAYLDSLGWAYYKKGMMAEALEYMKRAVEGLPNDSTVRDHLGDVYFSMGNTEKAGQEWRKAFGLDPGNAMIREKLEDLKKR